MTNLKTEEISILLNDLDKDRECGSTIENELVEIVKRGEIKLTPFENYLRCVALNEDKPTVADLMDDNSDDYEQPKPDDDRVPSEHDY